MKKILLIDDSRALRVLLARHLRARGWEVLEAGDGGEGYLLALQHNPHLILLDVALPTQDGVSTLLRMRAQESLRDTPVIVVSGISDRTTVLRLARMGIQDYIVKPFTMDLLMQKVARALVLPPTPETPPPPAQTAETASSHAAKIIPWPKALSRPTPTDDAQAPRVLVVGGTIPVRARLREALADRFALYLAPDLEQAMQLSLTCTMDVVVVDLGAWRFDPVDACKRLRFAPHLVQTPFILVRGGEKSSEESLERLGLVHFLEPPLQASTLAPLVASLVDVTASGYRGGSYLQMVQGVPVLRWPTDMRMEQVLERGAEVLENLDRAARSGRRSLVVLIPSLGREHDGHLRLMLDVLARARGLGLELGFCAPGDRVREWFGQCAETAGLSFFPSVGEAWRSLVGE